MLKDPEDAANKIRVTREGIPISCANSMEGWLSMNRPLTPSLYPSEGGEGARRAGEGDGSWSQCVRKSERRLPMNPEQHRTPNAEMSKDSRCHSMFGVGCSR